MKNRTDRKGMVIVSILMVTVVLLIMTTSMLIIHSSTMGFITTMEKQTVARKLAESGVAYALYSLKNDPVWGEDDTDPNFRITVPVPEVKGKFDITFVKTDDCFSVNNVGNGADPNRGYKNSGVPGYSVDLLVTGVAGNVSKKYRVILQTDSFYDGALASGAIETDANSVIIRNLGTSSFLPGSMHSNSVLGMVDPNGNIIQRGAKAFAIDPNNTQTFNLYGGVISAQGKIDIDPNANPNVQVNENCKARHMKPVNIQNMINDAVISISNKGMGAGSTYIVGKNSVTPALCTDGSAYEVNNGKLILKKDIVFENNVTIQFDYDALTAGMTDKNEIEEAVQNASVYMDANTYAKAPSIYVTGPASTDANLTIKGPVTGNGAFYVNGDASYIGESNLVASADPGVAVLATGDIDLKLPSITRKLDLNMTGLVYSGGNANVDILESDNSVYPIEEWPSTWSGVSDLPGNPGNWEEIYYDCWSKTRSCDTGAGLYNYQIVISGTGDAKAEKTSATSTKFSPNSGSITITVYRLDDNNNILYSIGEKKLQPGDPNFLLTGGDPPSFLSPPLGGDPNGITPEGGQLASKVFKSADPIGTTYQVTSSPSATKVPPNFNFIGALVSIDPNNPVPSIAQQDIDMAGNINIHIGGGNLCVTCDPTYLKLLRVVKGGSTFRVVTWTEL